MNVETFEEFKSAHLGKILPDYIMQSTKSGVPIVVLAKGALIYKEKKAGVVFVQLKKPYKCIVMDDETFHGTIKLDGKDTPRFVGAQNNEEVLRALYEFQKTGI